MKLTNQTQWSTADLKRFLVAGLRAKGADVERMRITIYTSKRGGPLGVGGYAWYDSHRLKLGAPKVEFATEGRMTAEQLLRMAQVLEHEIDHTFGLRHGEMLPSTQLRPTWQEGLEIRVQAPKPTKPKPSLKERRAELARKQLAVWEAKVRRAENRAKYWRRKVRYYERTTPATGED